MNQDVLSCPREYISHYLVIVAIRIVLRYVKATYTLGLRTIVTADQIQLRQPVLTPRTMESRHLVMIR